MQPHDVTEMNATNFDDPTHRVESATVAFQKGLYHLFLIKKRSEPDIYGQVIRTYQCLFQICLTQLLLDSSFPLNGELRHLSRRLRSLCQDPNRPTRSDLDPACLVTHSIFENRRWSGFPIQHSLHSVSQLALDLYGRVVKARHNLLYRPFLLDGLFWEDCTLINLVGSAPSTDEIEQLYQQFVSAIWDWRAVEQGSRLAQYFIQMLFIVYKDRGSNRPTETLLLTYARMLNPNDSRLIADLREYRNELLRLRNDPRYAEITFLREWRVGEV
jgi:hypothetical protein